MSRVEPAYMQSQRRLRAWYDSLGNEAARAMRYHPTANAAATTAAMSGAGYSDISEAVLVAVVAHSERLHALLLKKDSLSVPVIYVRNGEPEEGSGEGS